jgi:hypothetical protein
MRAVSAPDALDVPNHTAAPQAEAMTAISTLRATMRLTSWIRVRRSPRVEAPNAPPDPKDERVHYREEGKDERLEDRPGRLRNGCAKDADARNEGKGRKGA